MIFLIWLCINELQPNCGVVTGISCLIFIVPCLVAEGRRCLGCRLKGVRFGRDSEIPRSRGTSPPSLAAPAPCPCQRDFGLPAFYPALCSQYVSEDNGEILLPFFVACQLVIDAGARAHRQHYRTRLARRLLPLEHRLVRNFHESQHD